MQVTDYRLTHGDNKKSIYVDCPLRHASMRWSRMKAPSINDLTTEFSGVMSDDEPQISAGDHYNIDNYVRLVEQLGYDIDYQNVVDEFGFIAQVTINGENHVIWQGGITDINQSVLSVQRPLEDFEKKTD
jgi:hypothetical protein